jgi:hypothetical protein
LADAQLQVGPESAVGQYFVESLVSKVPSQRVPRPTLLRYSAQSVSAWDHSPQIVGPQLYCLVMLGTECDHGRGYGEEGRFIKRTLRLWC